MWYKLSVSAICLPLAIFDGVLRPSFDLRTKTSPALTKVNVVTGRRGAMCRFERSQALHHHLGSRR